MFPAGGVIRNTQASPRCHSIVAVERADDRRGVHGLSLCLECPLISLIPALPINTKMSSIPLSNGSHFPILVSCVRGDEHEALPICGLCVIPLPSAEP